MAIVIVTLLAALTGTLLYYMISSKRYMHLQLPPGPKRLPIVGNLLDLPKSHPWVVYRDWSEQYGSDIIFLDLPTQPTVVLNSFKAATDLMEKRSSIYSDKPAAVMDELTGWEWNVGLMPYGERWRSTRRAVHEHFRRQAVSQYHTIQTREVRAFLRRAVASPERGVAMKSISQTFATIALGITYGKEIKDDNDELLSLSQTAVEALAQSRFPGAFWVEYCRWLKYIPAWVPGSSARKFGEKWKPIVMATRDKPFDDVLKATSTSTATPCIAQKLIQKLQTQFVGTDQYEFQERVARDATGITYAAAVDTQTSTMAACLLGLILVPHIQKTAQQELDSVVGPGRMPEMTDLAALPYIHAIVMEGLRWKPVLPLGVSHRLMVDDEYNGYFIPAGSIVTANAWAMLHNPIDYPDPETFNPDRFMLDGALDPGVPDPIAGFGFGRRLCPGRHIAKETLALMVASILHVFNVEPTNSDGDGVNAGSTNTWLSYPESLPGRLKVRSSAAMSLINADLLG